MFEGHVPAGLPPPAETGRPRLKDSPRRGSLRDLLPTAPVRDFAA